MDDPEAGIEGAPDGLSRYELEEEWEDLKWEDRMKRLVGWLNDGETWEFLEPAVKGFRDSENRKVPSLLHHLSESKETYGFDELPESTRVRIMASLLSDHLTSAEIEGATGDGAILEHAELHGIGKDEHPYPILTSALIQSNFAFLNAMENQFKDDLARLLQIPYVPNRRNSLHNAFVVLRLQQRSINGCSSTSKKRITKQSDINVMTKIVQTWVKAAPDPAIEAVDQLGNTPLHYAMNYELCYYLDAQVYRSTMVELISKRKPCRTQAESLLNKNGESPYLTYLHSEAEFIKAQLAPCSRSPRPGPPAVKTIAGVKSSRPGLKRKGKNEEEKEKPREEAKDRGIPDELSKPPPMPSALDPRATKKPTPQLPPARGIVRQNSLRHRDDLRSVVTTSAPRSPLVKPVTITAKEQATAQTRQGEFDVAKKQAADAIRQYLRLHYIRNISDINAKTLLYGKISSDKNLYFDAAHLRGREPAQVVQLIRRLSAAGGFEDTLSYVRIPQLSEPYWLPEPGAKAVTANDKRSRRSVPGPDKTLLGRNALVSIFDELAAANVRHIIRLHVEDNGDELAHSDTAIERAIKGRDFHGESVPCESRTAALGIETWDWRKPDLSIDVIHYAAPRIKTLHLHWSGGQTVLRGWAKGIVELYTQYRELQMVHLHAYQGLESEQRTNMMLDQFKSEVVKQTERKVEVERDFHKGRRVIHTRADDEYHNSPDTGDTANETQYAWVTRMEEFRDAMLQMYEALNQRVVPPSRIKVALIDDGLDYGDFDVYPLTQIRGFSCYPAVGQTEHPWHKSTHGHGTAMANMILRINPWIHLLVMRIEDGISYAKPGIPSRTIQANSVAHAVETAVMQEVNIISMSWTLRKRILDLSSSSSSPSKAQAAKKSIEEVAIDRLETAIKSAAKDKILMVCSAADDIELLGKDTLPYSAAEHEIFRIGSCNSQAQRDSSAENKATISYFLPGIQVPEARRPHSIKPIAYHDGSSIATALAAGLMSMILHCVRYVAQCHEARILPHDGPDTSRMFTQWAEKLRKHKHMRTALNNIVRFPGNEEPDDTKQLPVYRIFGDATAKLMNASGSQKIERLETLVRHLCHGIDNGS